MKPPEFFLMWLSLAGLALLLAGKILDDAGVGPHAEMVVGGAIGLSVSLLCMWRAYRTGMIQ